MRDIRLMIRVYIFNAETETSLQRWDWDITRALKIAAEARAKYEMYWFICMYIVMHIHYWFVSIYIIMHMNHQRWEYWQTGRQKQSHTVSPEPLESPQKVTPFTSIKCGSPSATWVAKISHECVVYVCIHVYQLNSAELQKIAKVKQHIYLYVYTYVYMKTYLRIHTV